MSSYVKFLGKVITKKGQKEYYKEIIRDRLNYPRGAATEFDRKPRSRKVTCRGKGRGVEALNRHHLMIRARQPAASASASRTLSRSKLFARSNASLKTRTAADACAV